MEDQKEVFSEEKDEADFAVKNHRYEQGIKNANWMLLLIPEVANITSVDPFLLAAVVTALLQCQEIDHYNFTLKQAKKKVYEKGYGFEKGTSLEKDLRPFLKKYIRSGYQTKGGTPLDDRVNLSCVVLVDLFKRFTEDHNPHHQYVARLLLEMFPIFKKKQKRLENIGKLLAGPRSRREPRLLISISKEKYSTHKNRYSDALDDLCRLFRPLKRRLGSKSTAVQPKNNIKRAKAN